MFLHALQTFFQIVIFPEGLKEKRNKFLLLKPENPKCTNVLFYLVFLCIIMYVKFLYKDNTYPLIPETILSIKSFYEFV